MVIDSLTPKLPEGFQYRTSMVKKYYLICGGNVKLHRHCLEGYFGDLSENLQGKYWFHTRIISKAACYFFC